MSAFDDVESRLIGYFRDPRRLSQFLLQQAIQKGAKLHQPCEVIQVLPDETSDLHRVTIQDLNTGAGTTIANSKILISAGAWSGKVFDSLFPNATADVYVGQLAGHSIVVESPRWTREHEKAGCHAVFSTLRSGFSPEIFSRIGGELYVAGLNDASMPLPRLATDAKTVPASVLRLKHVAERLLGNDGTDVSDLKIIREGICFRPITRTGNPIISRVHNSKLGSGTRKNVPGSVFIAAGHGPWGISLSLGTGKVMAEMLEDKATSADLSRLALR